jgi:hypothetical protein
MTASSTSPSIREFWPSEGTEHVHLDRDWIFRDHHIDEFLNGHQCTYLIATKGMGKTLLLRTRYHRQRVVPGSLLIPNNDVGEFDRPDFFGSVPGSMPEDLQRWRDIWTISILFSILSQPELKPVVGVESVRLIRHNFPDAKPGTPLDLMLQSIEQSQAKNPSYYLAQLLQKGSTVLAKLLQSLQGLEAVSHRHIQNGVWLFIDSVDTVLADKFPGRLKLWHNAQNALLLAAYQLSNANRHIHIYASIRQEAWAAFDHEHRGAISGKALLLEYSVEHLRKMFLNAVKLYAKCDSLLEFLGVTYILNGLTGTKEDPFDYIHRHTIGTPRSLMQVGHTLARYSLSSEITDVGARIELIRSIVNNVGLDKTYNDYLISQKRMFLTALSEREDIDGLLRMISTNVLRGTTLRAIAAQFQADRGGAARYQHPFCELFNNGLLGTVEVDPANPRRFIQKFQRPHEFDWHMHAMVSDDRIYLLHPSIQSKVRTLRPGRFYLNPSQVIGHGREWKGGDDDRIYPTIFVSHARTEQPEIKKYVEQLNRKLHLLMPCDFWIDTEQLPKGATVEPLIDQALDESDLVLAFVSRAAIDSPWFAHEWGRKQLAEFNSKELMVIPCNLDGVSFERLPPVLRAKNAAMLCGPPESIETELNHLAHDIAREMITRRFRDLQDIDALATESVSKLSER